MRGNLSSQKLREYEERKGRKNTTYMAHDYGFN